MTELLTKRDGERAISGTLAVFLAKECSRAYVESATLDTCCLIIYRTEGVLQKAQRSSLVHDVKWFLKYS